MVDKKSEIDQPFQGPHVASQIAIALGPAEDDRITIILTYNSYRVDKD
jgi:hypothetical protein